MPCYDFKCGGCGRISEYYARMDDRVRDCKCGGTMCRLITSRYGINRSLDFVTDNITGDPVHITSKRQHERLCREHNVTPKIGKGWW